MYILYILGIEVPSHHQSKLIVEVLLIFVAMPNLYIYITTTITQHQKSFKESLGFEP